MKKNFDVGRILEVSLYGVVVVLLIHGVDSYLRLRPKTVEMMVSARSAETSRLLKEKLALNNRQTTVIEFMDFQCPPCRAAWPEVKTLLSTHPNVSYRSVNYPLEIHPFAFDAAVAYEIAKQHGLGKVVFDDLFTGKTNLDRVSLNHYLAQKELPAIIGSKKGDVYKKQVERDMDLGKVVNIRGTPTLLVRLPDGRLLEVAGAKNLEKVLAD